MAPVLPFSEPNSGFDSPYYKQTHHDFRAKVRAFVDKEIIPYVSDWEETGTYPPELHQKAYDAGIYSATWPVEYGGTPPPDFDAFHDFIFLDELARAGCGGFLASALFSFNIGLPPILVAGSTYLKDLVARDVITGKKILALCISEPHAGSDVAALRTTAHREGDYYIVSGEKKWITSGMKADYYTVAVRTGGPGIKGISLLLIPRNSEGVFTRRMKTQGWLSSNTAFISFDKVKVPVKNLIGQENQGFKLVMHNFNHERWAMAVMSNRYSRVCIAEAIKYARTKNTFGKRIIDHQVIRHKIADMARQVETTHAWIEQITWRMANGATQEQLGGQIAMLKVQATRVMEFCAREASQILGGASYLREGKGEIVERLYREVRVQAIGGGSEEILNDLAMKQAKL
mmetsp:Transcript_39336/g.47666  ORF Transcript_39336/g.47666 Transcript_39336/m.47666 type:complete len:402 (-) Transcript_39336:205-1410(-)|eukprot:CAMPEP_0197852638 /NCGR_PEP_ID=MMETSP1438-20131217/21122_1 /TAXON_ID=1461541 /ORGANISM="Pterosperma sp., Strain CCMP1384" /LENGTH=401 /DNA_ID=CAMNT_0043466789 /DNA_START=143 /DNA_END=1348 /DNA_ORIENTATION=+